MPGLWLNSYMEVIFLTDSWKAQRTVRHYLFSIKKSLLSNLFSKLGQSFLKDSHTTAKKESIELRNMNSQTVREVLKIPRGQTILLGKVQGKIITQALKLSLMSTVINDTNGIELQK